MKSHFSIAIVLSSFLFFTSENFGQSPDFMLQGWNWNYPLFYTGIGNQIDYLAVEGEALKEAGFTYVWLPPLAKATNGAYSVGYNVRDYYDIGDHGPARWGDREGFENLKTVYSGLGLHTVADIIFNHRDGGAWEDNPAVEGWIENMTYDKIASGDQPYPSDRYRCYLPVGGTSGNGAGTYYFKIHSASQHSNFYNKPYELIFWTNTIAADYVTTPIIESEPNGGGDCGEINTVISLGKRTDATIDDSGCGTDEFALTITSSDFNAAGDTLWIRMYNTGSGGLADMSDHFIYGLWSGSLSADIQSQIVYQTATDFTHLPSGMGAMNYMNFKPNGNPTQLSGDQDAMYFYYDLDQAVTNTQDVLYDYAKYLWTDEDIRGFRMDAVKHFPAWFTGDMLDYLHYNGIDPGMVVGENYDYTPGVLKAWIDEVQASMDEDTKSAIDVRVFDFALRNDLDQACDADGYDVRNLFNSGMVDAAGASGFNVVTFVNNHDFRDGDQPVSNHPELAYAYILTNNKLGVPCVFFSDYFEPLNLKYKINGLMEAHKKYIYGASQVDYLNRFSSPYYTNYIAGQDYRSLIYQLSYAESGREVIVAINFSDTTLKCDQTINTANIFPGDTLTDMFSSTPYDFVTVQDDNQIYIELPAKSFTVFVEGDLRNDLIDISTPVAIENDPQQNSFSIYPNPADDRLYYEMEDMQDGAIISITDTQGKLVLQQTASSAENMVNIKKLPAGMYFFKMNCGNTIKVSSFIKN